MAAKTKKEPMISTVAQSQVTNFLGVAYSVLLPRERSECVEILLERFPKGLAFPVHQHKECEQTYLVLEGEAEVTVADEVRRVVKEGVVYIPRLTDHCVRNVGILSWFTWWSRPIPTDTWRTSQHGTRTLRR